MARTKKITDKQIEDALSPLSEGKTLIECSKLSGISYSYLNKRISDSDKLKEMYARGREAYSHYKVAEMHAIAADKNIEPHRARLMCDNIKWEVAKVIPKFYGDKIQADVDTSLTVKLVQFGGKEDK